MTHNYEPQLLSVKIAELRPTQITVGFLEVAEKRREWLAHAKKNGPEFLGRHMVPVVRGPKDRLYLIDHHHLARALADEGQQNVLTSTVCDLSYLSKDEFWSVMDHRHWIYPFDTNGIRQPRKDIPKTVADLTDDPYRSLAGALCRVGGFAKDLTPYSEFMWADFLRTRVAAELIAGDLDKALREAMALAHGRSARYLPGWCGISN